MEEWLEEVKSWQWLALRVRLPLEPVSCLNQLETGGTGVEDGRGEKDEREKATRARGDWRELGKLGEAMEWLESRGLQRILIDAGVGSHRNG